MPSPLKLTPEELAQEALRMQSKLAAGLETLREVDNFDYGSTARQEVWRDGKTFTANVKLMYASDMGSK